MQSFQAGHLEKMNRYYSKESYEQLVPRLIQGPIGNFSLDFIYGFEGQGSAAFWEDLVRLQSYHVPIPHLSIYALTVEEQTPYAKSIQDGRALAPDEGMQAELYSELASYLSPLGLEQYEISNFAQSGRMSRHNLRYWLYEPYIGLGPGAHGFLASKERYANPRNLRAWKQILDAPDAKDGALARQGTPHRPSLDLPLCILRLTLVLPLRVWRHVVLEKAGLSRQHWELCHACLVDWTERDIGRFVQKHGEHCFEWTPRGICFLNDYTLELHTQLESISD